MSRTWHFYTLSDGLLLGREFSGPEYTLGPNIPAECGAVEGRYDHLCQRVDVATGEVIDYQPPAPADDASVTHAWDTQPKRWLKVPTLFALKVIKWSAMKAAAQAADQANIVIATRELQADSDSRAALFQKYQIALIEIAEGGTFSVDWTLANNTEVTLNAAQFKAIIKAIDARSESIRTTLRGLRDQIAAASTPEALDAIGWP